MTPWRDEYERRCRRLLDITDDTLPVEVESETTTYGTLTGSETYVVLHVGHKSREFLWMGDLIKALDAVPDDQVS